jgi:hypothetical protein
MPRYYFDLREGDKLMADEEGLELRTVQRVQEEAARSLADMARDTVGRGLAQHDMAIEVRDNEGPVLEVKFTFNVRRLR